MKALTAGLYEYLMLENRTESFWMAIGGRLYDTEAPQGAEFPYAVYSIVSDTDIDTFTENMNQVYIQFSLFSGLSSSGEVKDIDSYLTAVLKDKVFAVDEATVVSCHRVQGNGPMRVQADVEAGAGAYWRMDADYEIFINRS